MPTLELAEFKEGLAKGFKFWYPKVTDQDAIFYDGVETVPKQTHDIYLYILNLGVKNRYAEKMKETKIPKLLRDLPKSAQQQVGETLAKMYPEGILNTKEDALNNPPWKD